MQRKMDEAELLEIIKALKSSPYLEEVAERNPYLALHVRGKGGRVSRKWNAKIYRGEEGKLKTLVTNDFHTLRRILSKSIELNVGRERTVYIDDAGIGFPIGGAVIGVYEEPTSKFLYDVIPVDFFKGEKWRKRLYREEASRIILSLLEKLGAKPEKVKIKICTGEIFLKAKETLRERSYLVEVDEIGDPLQTLIEEKFREYIIKEYNLPENLYFDPKISDPRKGFRMVINWIKTDKENRLKIAKTGWNYFKKW